MIARLFFASLFLLLVAAKAGAADAPPPATVGGLPSEAVADVVAKMIADAIPRDYEKYKDWGNTKRITTGSPFARTLYGVGPPIRSPERARS